MPYEYLNTHADMVIDGTLKKDEEDMMDIMFEYGNTYMFIDNPTKAPCGRLNQHGWTVYFKISDEQQEKYMPSLVRHVTFTQKSMNSDHTISE